MGESYINHFTVASINQKARLVKRWVFWYNLIIQLNKGNGVYCFMFSRKNKKEKLPVRKMTKWLWLLFWIILFAPFVTFGVMMFQRKLPQFRIPFETMVKDQNKGKDLKLYSLEVPFDENTAVADAASVDVSHFETVQQLQAVLGNQDQPYIAQKIGSYSRIVTGENTFKEVFDLYQFYGQTYYLKIKVEKQDGNLSVLNASLENYDEGEPPYTISNDSFANEYQDFKSQMSLTKNMYLQEVTLEAKTSTYTYKTVTGQGRTAKVTEQSFVYNRENQKLQSK